MTDPAETGQISDPFAVLGLPRRFDLGEGEIERAFLTRAAGAHPDAAGDDDAMADLTDARRVLADPERRANALLALLGGASKEADRSLPDGFLMEIMETRQQVEAELPDPEARVRWTEWAKAERARYAQAVGRLFERAGSDADGSVLTSIRTQLNAWRYIERLAEQLDPDYDPNQADFAG